MMDGRNSIGRKISLLNDSSEAAVATSSVWRTRPPINPFHSRTSSCASSPSSSLATPQLVRSTSSDSSRSCSSPSPLTPGLNFPLRQQHAPQQYYLQHNHFAKMDDHQQASMYPPLPDANGAMPTAYPMPPMPAQPPPHAMAQPQHMGQPPYRTSNSPSSEPSRVSTVSAQSASKSQPKKNQYPCPMAKQMGCNDFFTTSGHAARHAKKHTGKKDAFCPECNKAFTRKDNMEQHRRTHQHGRGASRTSNDDSKVKKTIKPPTKKGGMKTDAQLEAAVEQQLAEQVQSVQVQQVAQAAQAQQQHAVQQQAAEQALLMPASGPYFLSTVDTGPIPPLPMAMPDMGARPPLHRTSFASSLDYIPPAAAMMDPDTLHYSYPSPGLSNGLNSLALAASEHRHMSAKAHSPRSMSSDSSCHDASS